MECRNQSGIGRHKAEDEDGPERGHLPLFHLSILYKRAVAAGSYSILKNGRHVIQSA
jgi:hypothetical protein